MISSNSGMLICQEPKRQRGQAVKRKIIVEASRCGTMELLREETPIPTRRAFSAARCVCERCIRTTENRGHRGNAADLALRPDVDVGEVLCSRAAVCRDRKEVRR